MGKAGTIRALGCKARMAKLRCEESRRARVKAIKITERAGGPKSRMQPEVSGQQYNLEAGMYFAYVDAIKLVRKVH